MAQTQTVERLLYSLPEVCTLLNISRSKLYTLLSSGELKTIHLGSCVRVPATELRDFVKSLSADSER